MPTELMKTVYLPHARAIERITATLAEEDFGILTRSGTSPTTRGPDSHAR
jgi:hypothetical protein